MIGQKREARQ